jgi:hypothetical protein
VLSPTAFKRMEGVELNREEMEEENSKKHLQRNTLARRRMMINHDAKYSFLLFSIALLIEFMFRQLNLDRKSMSYITLFAFWPLYLVSFYKAINALQKFLKESSYRRLIIAGLIAPAFAFAFYFVIRLAFF